MNTGEWSVPKELPWGDSCEAELRTIAAGQWVGAEVAHVLQQAQRLHVDHPWGRTVVHHWMPAQHNGLAPLVLLHGGSGSWTHWVRNIEPLLEQGHALWAIDLPGFGDSDAPPSVVDVDGILPVLADVLQTLFPLQTVRLMGFSFGGMTAGMLAANYPHLIQQLVLVGAPGIGLSASHPFRLKGWRYFESPKEQLLHHVYNLGVLMVHDKDAIDRDMVALHVANVRKDQLPRRRMSKTDVLVRSLKRIDCPVAAIYGIRDVLYPDAWQQVNEHLASSSGIHWQGLQLVPDAGHWVQYEKPSAFHAALLPLLATSPP